MVATTPNPVPVLDYVLTREFNPDHFSFTTPLSSFINVKFDPTSDIVATTSAAGIKLTGKPEKIITQIGDPRLAAPVGNPVPSIGDVVVQTSDGTVTGQLQQSYIWDGTQWVPFAEPKRRQYYGNAIAYTDYIATAETLPGLAARGYTAVGPNSSMGVSSLGPYNNTFVWTAITPPIAQNAGNIAAIYNPPSEYCRHEIAITPGVANTYGVKIRSDIQYNTVTVWVCDPGTGAPVKRLHGTSNARVGGNVQGVELSLGPNEEGGIWNSNWSWVEFLVPAALVAAYKTAGNTLKFAIYGGIANGNGQYLDISGYFTSPAGATLYAATPFYVMGSQENGGIQVPLSNTANSNPYGVIAQTPNTPAAFVSTPASTSAAQTPGIRVSIPDTTRDIFLSMICPGTTMGYEGRSLQMRILSASGLVSMGRPKPTQIGPLANSLVQQTGAGAICASGWLIPAAVLAAKAITPANSGVSYLDIMLTNVDVNAAYITGFVAETV